MKSYNILKLSVSEFLRILQNKTSENAQKMKEIFDYTTSIKKNEPDSEERKIKLKNALLLNNEFIGINKRFIDLHNNILDIINDLADAEDENNEIETSDEQEKIITNANEITKFAEEIHVEHTEEEVAEDADIELKEDNPLLQDREYTEQLMQKYIELEEYEKCDLLQKFIESNN